MPGQIVTLTLPLPPAGVTHFQLQFRLFGVSGWTPFSTVATPAVQDNPPAGEDLPIEDLAAGEYVIDGQNAGATGNEVAASLPRTLYQACWKDADGYSNWGRTFRQKRVG